MPYGLESDYLQFEDPRTVTLLTRRAASGQTSDAISYATVMNLKRGRDIFGTAALTGDERIWNLPASLVVNTTEIMPGDVIREETNPLVLWTVQNVQKVRFGTQWICACVKQR